MKGPVAKLVLVGVSLVLTLGLAEATLRAVGYRYQPLQIAAGDMGDARVYHLFDDHNFVFDPELIWRPRKSYGVFNRLGFRGPEVAERTDRVRIATVGDSNTLGWADAEGANWPADLERLLNSGGLPAEVVNAGVWGYSSHQGVVRTREVLDLAPDIVLISFGSNDAHLVTRSDAEFSDRSLGALKRTRLGQLWIAVTRRAGGPVEESRRRVSEEDYRRNLETMIDEVRRAGATPVLLTRPFVGPVLDPAGWKGLAPAYNLATVEVAEQQSTLLIDVYSFFKGMDALFADESHFTRDGHAWAARVILEHLKQPLARLPSG